MENKSVLFGVCLFLVLIYFYFFALFLERNFLLVLLMFVYLMFFFTKDAKEKRDDLENSLLSREGKMKFDW